jgi:hypothetical protein
MNNEEKELKTFFRLCGLINDNANNTFDGLDGLLIERNILLDNNRYELVKKTIPELRKIYSSSFITSLHINAEKKQKWPLINIVRQILKINNYSMRPFRKSNGYDNNGKKKVIRYFRLEKIKNKKTDINHEQPNHEQPNHLPSNHEQ